MGKQKFSENIIYACIEVFFYTYRTANGKCSATLLETERNVWLSGVRLEHQENRVDGGLLYTPGVEPISNT
jgi:hypothetical protein